MFEELLLNIFFITGLICCIVNGIRISLPSLFIYLIASTMIVYKNVPMEYVLYFTILNILSFLLVFIFSREFLDISKDIEKKSHKKFQFHYPLIIWPLSLFMAFRIEDKITHLIQMTDAKDQLLNWNLWNEYLVILTFTGFILIYAILDRDNQEA